MNELNEIALANIGKMHTHAAMAAVVVEHWTRGMSPSDLAKTYTPYQIEAATGQPMARLAPAMQALGWEVFTQRTPGGAPVTYWSAPAAQSLKRSPGRPGPQSTTYVDLAESRHVGEVDPICAPWLGRDYTYRDTPSAVAAKAWRFYRNSFPGWANNPGGRLYCLSDGEMADCMLGYNGGNNSRTRCRRAAMYFGLIMGKRYRPGMVSLSRTLPDADRPAFDAEWRQFESGSLRHLDAAHKLNIEGERPDELECWRLDFIDHWKWVASQLDRCIDQRAAQYAREIRVWASNPLAEARSFEPPKKLRRH